MPIEKAAMPMRPLSRMRSVSTKPMPSRPSRLAAGTRQSSNASSEVSEERTPSLSSLRPARKPFVPRSTTIAEMPFLPAARSVTAITTAVSAMPPLVMKFFEPFSTKWSPSRTAVVRMPPASDPEPGSVSAQQPTFSPRGERRQEAAASAPALPTRWMCAEHSPWCAASESATPASARASSSISTAQSSVAEPGAAVLLVPAGAREPQRAELLEHLARETPAARPTRASAARAPPPRTAHGSRSSCCSSLSSKSTSPPLESARPDERSHGIPPSS